MGNKLDLDKYYTPKHLAEYCYNKALEVLGKENITEILEPSAGAGAFMELDENMLGFDIMPEHPKVEKQDFLLLDMNYKKGRLILGNPPYGRCLSMAQKFYKKSLELGDYIAFILPIGQLNNSRSMYEFDLIHSEDLGKELYSDRELHCCFNIYRRPQMGLNNKPISKLQDISIVRQDSKYYNTMDFDIRMCYWGNGSAGKILKDAEHYSAEYKIKVHNESLKEEIIRVLTTFDWGTYLNCIAMRKIQQFHIIEILQKEVKGIH